MVFINLQNLKNIGNILWHYIIYTVIWKFIIYTIICKFTWKFMIKWLLCEFIPLRFIITKSWEKIRPPIDPETGIRPPATFLIWVSGIISVYIAVFSIASQRYEARLDVIENRASIIFAQLGITTIRKETLSRISSIQSMHCPQKPELLKPITVFTSLFSEDVTYPDIVKLMKETLEIWKDNLEGVDLRKADLTDARLYKANLTDANLCYANFTGADLRYSNLTGAIIFCGGFEYTLITEANLCNSSADFKGAHLYKAILTDVDLTCANFSKADLTDANLTGTNLYKTNLTGANLTGAYFTEAQNIPSWIKEKLDRNGEFKK